MIEFDVLPDAATARAAAARARLRGRPRRAARSTLDEGLDHFAGEAYADVELDVDLKLPGYERGWSRRCAEHGLADRTLVSTMYGDSLRAPAPRSRPGCDSAGRCRACGATTRSSLLAPCPPTRCSHGRAPAAAARGGPAACARALRRGDGALAARHAARSWTPCASAGGELYVWTVDDAAPDRAARGARRRRRHHERPAAVRPAAGLAGRATARAGPSPRGRWPPCSPRGRPRWSGAPPRSPRAAASPPPSGACRARAGARATRT